MKGLMTLLLLGGFLVPAFSSGQETVQHRKILVVYYSRTGKTKKVALEIASRMNADIEEMIDKKDRSGIFKFFESSEDAQKERLTELQEIKKDPKDYDLIIIGTPVWDETVSTPVRSYLIQYKDRFPKKIAFFTTSRMTEAQIVVPKMEKITGKQAVAYTGFATLLGELSKEKKDKKMQDFVNLLNQQ